jgi:hypothetical protein
MTLRGFHILMSASSPVTVGLVEWSMKYHSGMRGGGGSACWRHV